MSELALHPTLRWACYVLVAMLASFELWVVWAALNPSVHPDYRAYFIDHTTTCLNRPVSGRHPSGTVVSFLPDGNEAAKSVRVCGWEGPVGDGTHAVGTSSRLRFVTDRRAKKLALAVELIAIEKDGIPSQRVEFRVNGEMIGEARVGWRQPGRFTFPIPEEVTSSANGRFEVELVYHEAVKMGPADPDTRWRSIKLLAAGIVER